MNLNIKFGPNEVAIQNQMTINTGKNRCNMSNQIQHFYISRKNVVRMTVMPIMMVMMMIINEIIVQFIIYELTSEEAQRHNGSL